MNEHKEITEYLNFLRVKASEPGGGKFYRVSYLGGRLYGTVWGRSKNELANHMIRQFRGENEERVRAGLYPIRNFQITELR